MNAVVKHEPPAQPLAVVGESAALLTVIERAARDPQVDVDKMERLMQMHERVLSRQAEQAFNEAMAAAQAEIGRIGADKQNSQTHSWYATYAAIDREVRPVYTRNGFALSFGTDPVAVENCVRVVCYVSHQGGYTRTYHVDMPADGKGAKGNDVMTKTHAAGSAMSYGQRYLLKLIFNIAIGIDPDDDDGNAASAAHSSAANDIDTSWFDAVKCISDKASRDKLKAEMVEHWRGVTNIPKALLKAYNDRINELRAAKP